MKQKKFDALMTRLDFIIERLDAIEFMIEKKLNVDVAPLISPPAPQKWNEMPAIIPVGSQNCAKCGIRLDSAMGYVCYNQGCPTFVTTTRMTSPGNLDYDV